MQLIRPTAGLSGRACVKLPWRHASHLCRGETGETMKRDVRHGGGSVYPLQGAAQAVYCLQAQRMPSDLRGSRTQRAA